MEFNRRGGGGDRGPRVAGVLAHVRADPHTTRLPSRDSTRAEDQLQRTRAPVPSRAKSAGSDRARGPSPGSPGSDWVNAIGNASAGASSAARRATGGALWAPCRRAHGASQAIGSDCGASESGFDCAVPLCGRLASATYKETEDIHKCSMRNNKRDSRQSDERRRRTNNRAPVPPFAKRAPT